jgi:hypothetical protein
MSGKAKLACTTTACSSLRDTVITCGLETQGTCNRNNYFSFLVAAVTKVVSTIRTGKIYVGEGVIVQATTIQFLLQAGVLLMLLFNMCGSPFERQIVFYFESWWV